MCNIYIYSFEPFSLPFANLVSVRTLRFHLLFFFFSCLSLVFIENILHLD